MWICQNCQSVDRSFTTNTEGEQVLVCDKCGMRYVRGRLGQVETGEPIDSHQSQGSGDREPPGRK